jgi:hypothetical protein
MLHDLMPVSPTKPRLRSALVSLTLLAASAVLLARPQDPSPGSEGPRFSQRGKWPEVDVGDPRLNKALSAICRQASTFWQAASSFTGREALKQKAIVRRRRKPHFRQLQPPPEETNLKEQEMASYYGFSSFSTAPEALREFRQIISIDEKQLEDPAVARKKLQSLLVSKDDVRKQAVRATFEKENLRGAAVDFGQLILMFIRSRLAQYSFASEKTAMVGTDRALVISFRQIEGNASLRISEPGRKMRIPVQGELYVREEDDLVLRITITVGRLDGTVEIRDEAAVDYSPNPSSAILPVSVLYRRFLNDRLYFENTYRYSDWQAIEIK